MAELTLNKLFGHKPKLQILRALEKAGVFTLGRHLYSSKLRAPLYHRFSKRPKNGYVSEETFKNHLVFASKTFRLLCPDTLYQENSSWDHGIVITVDDGYRDFYDVAFPILREMRVPAIVYLTTDFIDGRIWLWFDKVDYIMRRIDQRGFPFPLINGEKAFHREDVPQILQRLKMIETQERDKHIATLSEYLGISIPQAPPKDYMPLSWGQVREMAENGIAFGAHTCTHPILTQMEAKDARLEIRRSKERIEAELGRPVISFAYPNGDYNESVVEMVREAGFEYSFACAYGFINRQDDRYTLNRVPIGDRPLVYFRQDLCGIDILKQHIRNFLGKK